MNAPLVDARILFTVKECASDMERRRNDINAVVRDVQILFRKVSMHEAWRKGEAMLY